MKKIYLILCIFVILFVGCNTEVHVHTFETGWSFNKLYHWHSATCRHKEEVSDKAEHIFGEWKNNGDATSEKTKTANVYGISLTNVNYQSFSFPSSLITADLTGLDTSNVTDMQSMFGNCFNLKSLAISSFNTVNVENMEKMFCECSKLESLDVSNINTSNVSYMGSMFGSCSSLIVLDLSSFDISKITDPSDMFKWVAASKESCSVKYNPAK